MAKQRDERRGRGEPRDNYDGGPERDPSQAIPHEQERETLAALKAILIKVASVVKPLGLTPEESTDLVQRMYASVLEMDARLAGEVDDVRRNSMVAHVRDAVIRREDEVLVVDHPAST
ncbi:MAG: hypothetical protein ACYC6T_01520 [Thermoleophilia bacterium]